MRLQQQAISDARQAHRLGTAGVERARTHAYTPNLACRLAARIALAYACHAFQRLQAAVRCCDQRWTRMQADR